MMNDRDINDLLNRLLSKFYEVNYDYVITTDKDKKNILLARQETLRDLIDILTEMR